MSRHYFYTQYQDTPVQILMGFDRALGHYFLVIESMIHEMDEPIYSNLFEEKKEHAFPTEIDFFIDKLSELGLSVPVEMIDEITADARFNFSNKDIYHIVEDGVYRREFGGR